MDKGIEALREAVRRAPLTKPEGLSPAWQAYFDAVTPLHVAELIAALELAQQYSKKRDEENQDLMLTIGRLRVEREQMESAPSGMMQLSNELAEMKRKCVELTVWYGAMPESNGKTNWTAILHRKGESLSAGITIDRSEYPDRVRYEADRMRYLIGELEEKPWITNYDANKHSGYTARKETK